MEAEPLPAALPRHETDAILIGAGGPARPPRALLPGAFNPVHAGHWGLAAAASQFLGDAVAFELSVCNVDKPPLDAAEVRRRLAPFRGRADVWLTCAPLFTQKARLFPGCVFVIGADTAARVVAPRYYAGDQGRDQALRAVADLGCRFLVAARADPDGALLRLDTLDMPAAWRSLFQALDPEVFRLDISSTALRGRG